LIIGVCAAVLGAAQTGSLAVGLCLPLAFVFASARF
jgi:hypothetical protein